jgi:multidrug efflux pump subunit AcrA (membrane-fusion protein)
MHPSYTSDKPGECPICGMTLEPVTTSAEHAGRPSTGNGDVAGLTSVTITPERIQLIGVRTARVERSSASGQLDLVGFVTPDESRIKRVQIRVSGWIRELYVNQTGYQVRAGQPLMSIYSPELFQSEQEYLINRGGTDSTMHMTQGVTDAASSERLRLLGVPDDEIHRLDREGTASTQLVLRSPVGGTVLERGVVEGQYVSADTPLLTVADLSRVWVVADLYEMDMTRVHAGDAARFTSDAMPTRTFSGRVDFVYPTVSNETRTLKVRLALENPSGMLRPGMYGRVSVSARGALSLSVPAEAVVNTGEHAYVFLAHPGGRFEPRMVWTGMPEGDRIQILKGLAEGDTVVSSASFLIDSESRLKAAIAGLGSQPGMAGMEHGAGGAK